MNPPVLPQRIIDIMDPKDRAKLGKAGRTSAEILRVVEDRSEKDLHRDIVRYLNVFGLPFCHARMDRKSSIAEGYPDFTFPYRGFFVAWEAKTATGKLSGRQHETREAIERNGGKFKVIRQLEEAKNHLRELDALVTPKVSL
jgi:hypothetical protein